MRDRHGPHARAVLLVAKVRAGGHAYYFEPTGTGGHPATEAPGQWVGRGATTLGLEGRVARERFETVLDATDPEGGALPGADRRRVTVVAFDLTFCAPKSVSLLHGLSDPAVSGAVGAGHERAVRAGLAYLEDHALAVRRRREDAPRVPVPAEGAAAAAFVHRTSRALDPHLHTHVVLANVGRGPEGSWSALDGRGVYAHAAAAGALYQSQLRHELTASLGVDWGPLHHGRADVAGIEREARLAFSRRSQQIAAHLAERGLVPGEGGVRVSRRGGRVAALATRAGKQPGVTVAELQPEWRDRARAFGLGPRRLEAVLDRVPHRAAGLGEPTRFETDAVAGALADTQRTDRAFSRRDVVRAWAASLSRGAEGTQVAAVVDRFMFETGAVPPERADARGVAEARIEWPERFRRRELEIALERRGVTRELGATRERDRGRGRGRDEGLGLGLG